MKKIYSIIFFSLIFLTAEYLNGNNDSYAEAIKFIKLSNTYREARDYENALKFLKRSQTTIDKTKSNRESQYWLAAIDESFYYIYRDLGLFDDAKQHLDNAIREFSKIISQKDGSPLPLDLIQDNMKNLDYQKQLISPVLSSNSNILNLDNQKLKSMPNDIPTKVENLSISSNRFKDFPTALYSLTALKYLNISNNKLRNIRIDFYALRNLVWLNISRNKIRKIDGNIQELKNIQFLDLSDNSLKELPFGIENLKTLKILNLKNNKIPFEQISNLIRALPNTNILYDVYVLAGEDEEAIEE